MRLIDADALMPNAEYKGANDVVSAYDIKNAPTIDPVKHGHWIARTIVINNGTKSKTKIYTQCKCSVCGAYISIGNDGKIKSSKPGK